MQVGKGTVVGVGVAFAACLGTIGFLLGRESARMPPSPPPVVAPAPEPVAAAAAPPPAPAVTPAAAPVAAASAPAPVVTPAAAPEPPPTVVAEKSAPPPSTGHEADDVRAYFASVDGLQSSSLFAGSDANEAAQKLLASSMSGDTSGFDDIIRSAEDGEAKARALPVPPACASYHQQLLSVLHDGVALTRSLKDALRSQDPGALAALSSRGSALQTRAETLEQTERALKSRYGIP